MTAPNDDVAALNALLDQLTGAPPAPPAAGASALAATDDGEAAELLYDNVAQFVDEYLRYVVERRIAAGSGAGVFWCAKWWAHPEALSRIYALWRAWEALRVTDKALGMSVWWRDHLDPHLTQLTSEYGPFGRCQPPQEGRPGRHHEPKPMPTEPMPTEVLVQFPEGRQPG
ncbi:DUF4913 domain-containing protein [Planosporangium sp. 12N6]|uniref:DUF4913 domain-containing protein n=1 Tax=Planosporangium spinosum TaxID=3402278 RepID=UPI003CF55F9A